MDYYFADAHSCLPLRPDTNIEQLRLHYDAGIRYVSINVGMDMNPLPQVMTTIAGFRQQIKNADWLILASHYNDIEQAEQTNKLAISFDLEGSIPLLNTPAMVDLYHQLGVRQIHLVYNRNNSCAGGAHDEPQGLTTLGKKMVQAIHEAGIIMDMSHSGEQTALDICELSLSFGKPAIFSHANPKGLVMHGRNISDKVIKATAQTGGIIGVNGVGRFVGDESLNPNSLVPHIDYIAALVGIDYVALGLDYCYDDGINDRPDNLDPGYWWPKEAGYDPIKGLSGRYVSPAGYTDIANGLTKLGYSAQDIKKVLRDNLHNLIKKVWL